MTYLAPALVLLVVLASLRVLFRLRARLRTLERTVRTDLEQRLAVTLLLAESMAQLEQYRKLLNLYEKIVNKNS